MINSIHTVHTRVKLNSFIVIYLAGTRRYLSKICPSERTRSIRPPVAVCAYSLRGCTSALRPTRLPSGPHRTTSRITQSSIITMFVSFKVEYRTHLCTHFVTSRPHGQSPARTARTVTGARTEPRHPSCH